MRCEAENKFVGRPLNSILVPWLDEPDWEPNPKEFVDVIMRFIGERDNVEETEIILICRSGCRSEDDWNKTISPIVEAKCSRCHANIHALPNITKYEVIKKLADVDLGAGVTSLTRISHIHLFGIAFIFFFVGFIFSFAVGFNKWLKALIIITPFAFLLIDVSAWWLTRIDPAFAWLVIISGFGYSIASTVMLSTSLYQMWIMPLRGQTSNKNAWSD